MIPSCLSSYRLFLCLTAILVGGLELSSANAATITVTSNADTSSPTECTLRDAISSINLALLQGGCTILEGAFGDSDMVEFDVPTPFTITLENGPLMVSADMSIRSQTDSELAIIRSTFGALHRIIHVDGARVNILNFTISDGFVEHVNYPDDQELGGGIYASNGANVRVSRCIIRNNRADIGGGLGADMSSTISIYASLVSENSAVAGGGVGAIDSSQVYIFSEAVIDNNHATELGGGIGMRTYGRLQISRNSRITNNRAYANPEDFSGMGTVSPPITEGGGISVSDHSRLFILDGSVVSGNTALNGGGIYISNSLSEISESIIENNLSEGIDTVFNEHVTLRRGFGGGVHLDSSTLTVLDTEIRGNSAATGGGLAIFAGSDAASGTISESTVADNIAQNWGGGMAVFSGTSAFVTNTTVSNNVAGEGAGGGIFPAGGGLYAVDPEIIRILNSTFTENTAQSGTGGGMHVISGSAILANTIVAGNDGLFGSELSATGGSLSLSSNANIYGDSSKTYDQAISFAAPLFPGSSDVITSSTLQNGDANLASAALDEIILPLGDNGGLTRTHLLAPNSPALNAANPSVCSTYVITDDQRGIPRDDGHCDIGSIEIEQPESGCYVIRAQNANVVTFCL
ncbi:hypothetical protein GCM10008090_29590 [Arenicella chitinivorans]|uniref:Right handed beta helix domain-containing protein n=1 Tax=Arenicella chitinivorans TaxID=1329800 RepID=A0A918RZ76_9GAMM|nr:choice-of-anchor Q domain-containing protein [Arenicella chitinivorans]GHA17945.1 hypothetical protein GCM10008090_29590 [Arenicella chitinivorans]